MTRPVCPSARSGVPCVSNCSPVLWRFSPRVYVCCFNWKFDLLICLQSRLIRPEDHGGNDTTFADVDLWIIDFTAQVYTEGIGSKIKTKTYQKWLSRQTYLLFTRFQRM